MHLNQGESGYRVRASTIEVIPREAIGLGLTCLLLRACMRVCVCECTHELTHYMCECEQSVSVTCGCIGAP